MGVISEHTLLNRTVIITVILPHGLGPLDLLEEVEYRYDTVLIGTLGFSFRGGGDTAIGFRICGRLVFMFPIRLLCTTLHKLCPFIQRVWLLGKGRDNASS